MARYANYWTNKFDRANRYFEEWSSLFKCERLYEYYEGFQWKGQNSVAFGSRPYVINLIYATIENKLANMLLNYPEFDVTAKPQFEDWDQDSAYGLAEIKGDALNTIISNEDVHFVDNIKLAALDAFFYFAVMEIGYSADWQNPSKIPPLSDEEKEQVVDPKNKSVAFEVPVNERAYFKWIPARRFRVSIADNFFLSHCAWCGYYTYFYRSALEKLDVDFKDLMMFQSNPQFSPDYAGPSRIIGAVNTDIKEDPELEYLIRTNEVRKVWKVWNNRECEKELIDGYTGSVLWHEPYSYISLIDYRHIFRLKGWYPIPPVWHWITPQNEVNEAREQMRNYRRRFKRKYEVLKGKVDSTEIDKLASDIDGEVVTVKEHGAIAPIGNPEIGISIQTGVELGFSDFNFVTGTAQIRESDRETATKSKIISMKEQVRESVERMNLDKFTCKAGYMGLKVMLENFTQPMWVRYSVNPDETDFMSEIQAKGPLYKLIYASQLNDGSDYTLTLRVNEASPSQTEEEMQKLITFLGILNQFQMVMFSPALIREVAYKTGYRNEKVIRQMQQSAIMQRMSQIQQLQNQNQGTIQNMNDGANGAGLNNGNAAASAVNNAAPSPINQITNQLNRQV